MRVMISHEHRESALASAWKALFHAFAQERIVAWYSSDTRPEGGMGTGEWWRTLHDRIDESDYLIAMLTRQSLDRPWILWECGLARGQENTQAIIPVIFGMKPDELSGPLSGFQSFQGDNADSVVKLCQMLGTVVGLDLPADALTPHVEKYLAQVHDFCEKDPFLQLFGKGFHRPDKTLEGRWEAAWYNSDGEVFENDTFDVLMEDDRVRIIGHGAKGYAYPMEGRLSSMRHMALTYWSVANIATCGTVLLQVHPSGLKMKGEWTGHTSKNYEEDDDLHLINGKVVCNKVTR